MPAEAVSRRQPSQTVYATPEGSRPVFVLRIGFSRALTFTTELPRDLCEFHTLA